MGKITCSLHASRKTIPAKYFKNLNKIDLLGASINITGDTTRYLEFKYGKNWRTPVQKWGHGHITDHYEKIDDFGELSWL